MIVVKVGGGASLNIDAVVADIVSLRAKGAELLLVHGGAQTTNAVAEALGHPAQFVTSETGHVSRRTDRRTLEIFEMVYCGQLNKMWVEKLQTKGINAVGLSGLDGRVFEGTRKDTLRIRVDGRRMVLRDECELALAGSVEEALASAREDPPDLVLLDLVMPGRSGFELLTELAARPGEGQERPRVARCHRPTATHRQDERAVALGAEHLVVVDGAVGQLAQEAAELRP